MVDGSHPVGMVSAANNGSAGILPISWMYITLMGASGLKRATQVALLNANYVARRLAPHYPTLYTGRNGLVAHECILDLRPIKDACGISAEDVAKRLADYGFHAPTLSFPVAGTLMVEPTESEAKHELDRFIDAMIAIRDEIRAVEDGRMDKDDNPLKNAPHTAAMVMAESWEHDYSRELAAFPLASLKRQKYWPPVGRVDNVYGDRNVMCSCVPMSAYAEDAAGSPDAPARLPRALLRLDPRRSRAREEQGHALQGTNARNTNAANITRCTAPCIMFVRPVAIVIVPMRKVSTSITRSLPPSPSWSLRPSTTDATATVGIVSPMLASAEPNARLKLVCSRSARAARTAAQVSGSSTSSAIAMPMTVLGAPIRATPASIAGDSSLASPITATSATSSRPKLAQATPADGGGACTSWLAASCTGRK